MIGGLISQSSNIRDETDRPLQIVGGDRPNNNNPILILRTRRVPMQTKQYGDRNEIRQPQWSELDQIKNLLLKKRRMGGVLALGFSGTWAAEFPRAGQLLDFGSSEICGAGFPKTEWPTKRSSHRTGYSRQQIYISVLRPHCV